MDNVERLLRVAKPEDQPLTPADEARLRKILATPHPMVRDRQPKPVRRSRPRTGFWLIPATLTAVITVVAAALFWPVSTSAYAATPPILTYSSVESSTNTVLAQLVTLAAAQPDKSDSVQRVEHVWGLATESDPQNQPADTTIIQPEKYVYTLASWGVAERTVYADPPYDTAGNPVINPNLPKPGTPLGKETYTEEDETVLPSLPESAEELPAYFEMVLPGQGEPPSTTAVNQILDLMYGHRLNPRQNAALLSYLKDIPGLELAGTTQDRLGRSVYALQSVTWQDHQEILLVNTQTGHFAGHETIYIGTTRTDIPSPAVISYTAWE